jgi:hypothetical protein
MVRRAVGSNQYRTRVSPAGASTDTSLLAQATNEQRRRCGEVWGTQCRVWVTEPDYSHDGHGVHSSGLDAHLRSMDEVGFRALADVLDVLPERTVWAVAKNRRCPPEVLEQLDKSPIDSQTRVNILSNPRCPTHLLETAVEGVSIEFAMAAASNPNTPPQALHQAARYNSRALSAAPEVLGRIVRNPQCPTKTLRMLVKLSYWDSAWERRVWVPIAQRMDCPPDVLRVLAGRCVHIPSVLVAVAGHPSLPSDLALELTQSRYPAVVEQSWANANIPDEYRALRQVAE